MRHHEPPEVTWLLPELEDGVDPELRLELESLEPDVELDPVELDPELSELEPLAAEALVVCVDPGRAKANAPTAPTLATVTAAVTALTLPRPRSLAAIAWRILSSLALLMLFSFRAWPPMYLDMTSRKSLRLSRSDFVSPGTGRRPSAPRPNGSSLADAVVTVSQRRMRDDGFCCDRRGPVPGTVPKG
jgi:hypothetical protein